MAYVTNRFAGEIPLAVTGTALKGFWQAFQINVGSYPTVVYGHALESHGDLDAPDGYVDIVNNVTYPQGSRIVPESSSLAVLRTTKADRKIVDIRTTSKKKFLSVRFKLTHDGNSTSIHEVFSDSNEVLSLRCGNTSAVISLLGETFNVTNYERFLVTQSALGSESQELLFELFATSTEYPVVGARCFATIEAKLSYGNEVFTATKLCSLLHSKRWQFESRIETLG